MDQTEAPCWLDKKFFENILQKSECDKTLEVSSCDINIATKPGEHFASIMFRVSINFLSKKNPVNTKMSLIVKTIPVLDGVKHEFIDSSIFDTEIKMYTRTLPEIQRLMETSGDKDIFFPRLIHQSKDPHYVIVFEDIAVLGYEALETHLDYENTKLIVERLAKFHAASYFMENDQQRVSDYDIGLFHENHIDSLGFLLENVIILTDVLKTWPGYEFYANKFKQVQDKFLHRGCEIYTKGNLINGFNVLNHGDFHYKNIMVIRDGEKINKLYLVDFQTCFYGSPAIDLIYVLYAIASTETRQNHRHDIIKSYYKMFIETLKNIGFIGKTPTLLDLNVELAQKGFLEVILTVCFLPFMFIKFDEINIECLFDQSVDGTDIKTMAFNSPEYQVILKGLLKEFLHKGLLDM